MTHPRISGQAHQSLARLFREWTGWDDAALVFGEPEGNSPYASLVWNERRVTINPEPMMLNPNRVLRTVNPFRLRQEAVITGALMHEAAHARYSLWLPRNPEDAETFVHSDGEYPSEATVDLARTLEEARIEGAFDDEVASLGLSARTLTWTMRAMAAHLIPVTRLSADPDQAMVDIISSWALRAGRAHAMLSSNPNWVKAFDRFLLEALVDHLDGEDDADPTGGAREIYHSLIAMVQHRRHTGSFMIDTARSILARLFPETPPDQMPSASAGCAAGDDEPGDQGQGAPGADESDDQDSGGDQAPDDDDEGAEGDEGSTLAAALEAMEAEADGAEADAAADQSAAPPPETPSLRGLTGGSGDDVVSGWWRVPTTEERALQRGAEAMLRDLVDPSESTKVSLTDTPSAQVDGAALAAWKASGGTRAPHFFRRTRREIEPEPPVQIAILVDVSSSMSSLQYPSALLSWALSSAAYDLRNFAGRGAQVVSTLVHWGTGVDVVQPVGKRIPGLRVVPCNQGTDKMHEALDAVAEQMPDFFTVTERPANRLLVQFTDWELAASTMPEAIERVGWALESGVNMLSVVPKSYSPRHRSKLPEILAECKVQRGRTDLLRYDPEQPGAVWAHAKSILKS